MVIWGIPHQESGSSSLLCSQDWEPYTKRKHACKAEDSESEILKTQEGIGQADTGQVLQRSVHGHREQLEIRGEGLQCCSSSDLKPVQGSESQT